MRVHLLLELHDGRLRASLTETALGVVQSSRTMFVGNRNEADAIACARAKKRRLSTYDVEDQAFTRSEEKRRTTIRVD
jgi:hypothetical protein